MNDSADLFAVYERLALGHRLKHACMPYLKQVYIERRMLEGWTRERATADLQGVCC